MFSQPQMHKQFAISEYSYNAAFATEASQNYIVNKNDEIKLQTNQGKNDTKILKSSTTEQKIYKPEKETFNNKKTEVKTAGKKEIKYGIFSDYPVKEDTYAPAKKTVTSVSNTAKSNQVQIKSVSKPPQVQVNTEKSDFAVKKQSENIGIKNTKPKTQKTEQAKQIVNKVPKKSEAITPQEEIIAWNEWNANVRNVILSNLAQKRNKKEIKLANGCSYGYTFTVASNGRISNVKVNAAVNTSDSLKVQESIKSIINSMAYTTVLNFPSGSQKQTYNVSSNISVSSAVKQDSKAKANDFSEYEKVVK
jgi:hypothetical protein